MTGYMQWSEVYEVPRTSSKLAQIRLFAGRFMIEGPPELVSAVQTIVALNEGQDSDVAKHAMYEMWAGWHVICSVTGKPILLCDLRYWDENNLIYARPELIPKNKPTESP